MRSSWIVAITLFFASAVTAAKPGPICHVNASSIDSAPAIEAAFRKCGHNERDRGQVIFGNETYTVSSVLNTTGLKNVDVILKGTLAWNNTNIQYWLNNSLPVGYQNQSSAWLFGGDGITWKGFGYGTLNGNGQKWYDFVSGQSNYPRRPHQITIGNTTNSVFDGLRFLNSQMWTMTIIHSDNVLLQNIYVNSTSSSGAPARNTDGADTVYANNITFRGWTVQNGDDCISLKANSTNILIEDCLFYNGLGIAIGSIGQYLDVFETVQNVVARNITGIKTRYGAYFKTWTGQQVGYPPNGGGGGLGFASDFLFEDFLLTNSTSVFSIGQCTTFSGVAGDCNTSLFNIHNITLVNWNGTTTASSLGTLQCSGDSPCYNIALEDSTLASASTGAVLDSFSCSNVENYTGFSC